MSDIEAKIKTLVMRSKNGDQDAMLQILEQFKPLRNSLVNKFSRKGVDRDDVSQQVDLFVIEAILNYDEQKDSSVVRHINSYAKRKISDYFTSELKYNQRRDILDNYIEMIIDFGVEDTFNEIEVEEMLNSLTDRQKYVIKKKLFSKMTTKDIANELNVTEPTISEHFYTAIEKLRKIL